MASTAFSEFAADVFTSLSSPRFAKKIAPAVVRSSSSYEAFMMLEMDGEETIVLAICAVNYDIKETRLWRLQLTEDTLLHHMEEDVGICDEEGIRKFGSRFVNALQMVLYYDPAAIVESSLEANSDISLHLVYNIADLRAETVLQLPLLQDKLHIDIYKLMIPSQLLSPPLVRKINSTSACSQDVGPSLSSSTQNALKLDQALYVPQPEAAKRRKGGGVNLMVSGRRR